MTGLPPIDPLLDERMMRLALQQALVAYEADEVPIGAVIAVGTRILAKSHNQVELLNDPTAHAEMLAITQATAAIGGKYLPQCTLYVTVEPCPMCMGALRWTQIGRIVYGTADPKGGYMHYSNALPHPKSVIVGGICEEECRELMVSYFRRKRRSR
ncbi:nucleoside deaminase [Porphyromonas uenonis]|uniref:nucleoside deaminase n=1 Tax=Porphyromonas uenonis TaxID=281920 RepID=UPI002671DA84|nr:nucleoside deaminase [Porphyromonas uenonis]